MYEKDGEKYFIVDSHLHFWDAQPGELGQGPRAVRQGLDRVLPRLPWGWARRRPTGRWSTSRSTPSRTSRRTSSRTATSTGHLPVDVPAGVVHERVQRHRAERRPARPLPGQAHRQRPLGPARRRGRARQLEADHAKYGLQGVKLYTAEWHGGLARLEAHRPRGGARSSTSASSSGSRTSTSTRARRSGRWTRTPSTCRTSTTSRRTTRSSTSSSSTCGLPRIEDFCFMATQEPNVYAGLAVVIGGLMHARPRFFAKVDGRAAVLGRRGQDAVRLGLRDLGAEVAGRGLRRLGDPDDEVYSDYPRLGVEGKKKILGLNAAKLYGIDVPEEFQLPGRGGHARGAGGRATRRRARVIPRSRVLEALGHGLRPGARRADHRARLRRLLRRDRRRATSTCACGCRRRSARRTSRSSWPPTHAPSCAGCPRCAR